jgi:FlaA1/EpsC-like NDP-sugar epimerase
MFKDKTFLVTGGTGSFGNTLINYLLIIINITILLVFKDFLLYNGPY